MQALKQIIKTGARKFGFQIVINQQRLLEQTLRHLQIDHVIDVGANRGQFAAQVRAARYSGPLTCFEPNSAEAALIPAAFHASVRKKLVGSTQATEDKLHVYGSTDFSSVYVVNERIANRFGFSATPNHTIAVGRTTLDDEDLEGNRIFLKIDTQGSEKDVLLGATGTLARTAALQVEVPFISLYQGAPQASALFELLSGRGFCLAHLYPVSREGGVIVDADCFFFRAPTICLP